MSRRATGVPARRVADLLFAVRAQDAIVFGEHENRQLQDFRRSGAEGRGFEPRRSRHKCRSANQYRILK